MAGRLYRMAKVVSANPKSWGIVDANEISGFKRVAKLSDLYSIAECILSSSYGDGVTDGADAVGQIWHVSETNGDYKLTNWASRKSAAGWTKLSYGGDVSVPVKDVQVDGTTVLSNGVANITLTDYAKKSDVTNDLKSYITQAEKGIRNGVAPLDRDNMIPLQYLGHLDMTVFTVVESLPTNDIENKVYLVKSSVTGDKNNYAEYIYTGNRNGVYDATKWEKLGEVAAKTDLSEYYKKTEVYNKTEINTKVEGLTRTLSSQDINNFTITPSSRGVQGSGKEYYMQASITRKGAEPLDATIPCVVSAADPTKANAGLMSPVDKQKLDGIEEKANNYAHPRYTAAGVGLYKISVDTFGHIFTTTTVKKEDITNLGIPGSAPTVDAAMSETSTNAVQNKVIDAAIKNHKINNSNLDGNLPGIDGAEYSILGQDSENDSVSALTDSFIYHYNPTTHSYLSIDGSTVWDDSNLTALTDGELTKILV